MLTLDREQTTALNYSVVNTSIQETFTAIDRFEWQASDELRLMRDKGYYQDGGHLSFETYYESELTKYGGYRRVRELLSAKKVVDTLPEELREKITKPSQTRPLLRLVKTPDKLQEVVAIAAKEKPFPTAADFAKAVQQVAPTIKRSTKSENPKTQLCNSVTVSSLSHPRYGDSGVIEADVPNHWQQIVTFPDGERLLINNGDLDAASVPFPRERTYPAEYTEAIAQIKEQHKLELERLEQELRIGLQAEAGAKAEAQVQEQIQSLQQLFKQQKEENIQLQQRLSEMEGLRKLEIENQQLQQRIQELEHAVQERPQQQWGNTMKQQATKALNKQVKQALEKTIDLRSLAQEPPKENAQECLRLMGMALKNLASAMNNTQALEAAAIILGSEPTQSAIAYRAEQLQLLPQAVSDIRRVLAQPGCSWEDFWNVAQEYEVIKQDYWAELTTQETDFITALQNASSQPDTIGVGSIVAHADPYRTLYVERGEVVEDLGDEVIVAWDHWQKESKKTDRYFRDELRFWQG
jgi:DNA repair exonuclease SbcCD ATPase subunit